MNAPSNWRVLEDTTGSIPGYMPPSTNPLPYFTKQVLSEEECDAIFFNVMRNYESRQLSRVYNEDGLGSRIDTSSRYTHYYDPFNVSDGADIERRFNEAANEAAGLWWQRRAEPVYGPQVLGYEEKCLFRSHCDNSIWTVNGWKRNDPDRDMTGLLYVSDNVPIVTRPNQFSGGQLVLDNIVGIDGRPLEIRPRKGQFIAFPSHPVFRHQVPPITRGYRITFVNWWRLR